MTDYEEAYPDEQKEYSNEDDQVGPLVQRRTFSTKLNPQRTRNHRRSVKMTAANSIEMRDEVAMRSARRGSEDWHLMVKPFVSDLTFRSMFKRYSGSEVGFVSHTCHAAVLFVDLSGYSKITSALADRGAHVLSMVVNAYLERILAIVKRHGGDVLKFAGDAVLVAWAGDVENLTNNLLCAARCSLELQEKAGIHEIEGTNLAFRIHAGISVGPLECDVFEAPRATTMQRCFHIVSGAPLIDISDLVDLAKSGEVCVSGRCVDLLADKAEFKELNEYGYGDAKLLTSVKICEEECLDLEEHLENIQLENMEARDAHMEEDFIHPNVLRQLLHGGYTPTHIAQMRNLCVLFIGMTSNGSSINWMMEMQSILEAHNCPIVQILDDDKGVHIVAAINLYERVPDTSTVGIDVCLELLRQDCGCAIGMAMGSTYCGVTGSSSVACRWDITGPPVVRAARLMQHALANKTVVVIDSSVYDQAPDPTRLAQLDTGIKLKGSPEPIAIYTLAPPRESPASMFLETGGFGDTQMDKLQEVVDELSGSKTRAVVLVTGPPVVGKKTICQRAAGQLSITPIIHVCDETSGIMQLGKTVATWFKHSPEKHVAARAKNVLEDLEKRRWSRAHDDCLGLITLAVNAGHRVGVIVDRVQFLDSFSLSLIKEALYEKPRIHRHSSLRDECANSQQSESLIGFMGFFCIHTPLYDWPCVNSMQNELNRPDHERVRIVEVVEATRKDLETIMLQCGLLRVNSQFLEVFAQASGLCVGYFSQRLTGAKRLSFENVKKGGQVLLEMTPEMTVGISAGGAPIIKNMRVMEVNADTAMKFSQIYDELPPRFQTLVKVIAMSVAGLSFFKIPVKLLWEVMNDIIHEGVDDDEIEVMLDEFVRMHLLKVTVYNKDVGRVVSFQCPAFGDVVTDVCTPLQIDVICKALIGRLQPAAVACFKLTWVIAGLKRRLGMTVENCEEDWKKGYKMVKEILKDDPEELTKWTDIIKFEIKAAGGSKTCELLAMMNETPLCCNHTGFTMPPIMYHLKTYSPPMAFGQLGTTMRVITQSFFMHLIFAMAKETQRIENLRKDVTSALRRYQENVLLLEGHMRQYGFGKSGNELHEEFEILKSLASPSEVKEEVFQKAEIFLQQFVPQFVNPRVKRLIQLVEKYREMYGSEDIPPIMTRAARPVQLAYHRLRSQEVPHAGCRLQWSLMTLAWFNYKPQKIPEELSAMFCPTVAKMRDILIRNMDETDLAILGHRPTYDDLEAFLLVSALMKS